MIFMRFSKEYKTKLLESIHLNKKNNIDNHQICLDLVIRSVWTLFCGTTAFWENPSQC